MSTKRSSAGRTSSCRRAVSSGSPSPSVERCLRTAASWFLAKVTCALADHGVQVVASTDNGADAVGTIVAEQPDLVLIEDTLSMLAAVQVIREVRRFSPETVIAQRKPPTATVSGSSSAPTPRR